MCVALTGGSGFVGSRILQHSLDQGLHVRALQHSTPLPEHENLTVISGGLSDQAALVSLVEGADYVVHCGGSVAQNKKADFFKINEQGTRNIVKAAEDGGVKKLLYISSMAAREPQISSYAASKYAGEIAVQESGLQWDIIRPPAVYGPGDQQLLPLMWCLKHRVGVLMGAKKARVSVIYVDDLAGAVGRWLDTASSKQRVYELGDGQEDGYTWRMLLEQAADVMSTGPTYVSPHLLFTRAISYIIKFAGLLSGVTPFLTPDKIREVSHLDWVCHDTRIETDLDWTPKVNFRDGIERTLRWYKEENLLRNLNLKDIK